MQKYRFHFLMPPDQIEVRRVWGQFVANLVTSGILPLVMYRTGRSKKAALRKPVGIAEPENVQSFLDKALNKKDWPEFVRESLWADGPTEKEKFDIWFESGIRAGNIVFYNILEFPDIPADQMAAFLQQLHADIAPTELIIFELATPDPDRRAYSAETGWIIPSENQKIYNALQDKTGFGRPAPQGPGVPWPRGIAAAIRKAVGSQP